MKMMMIAGPLLLALFALVVWGFKSKKIHWPDLSIAGLANIRDEKWDIMPLEEDGGGNAVRSGMLYLPNDGRFASSYLSEPLNTFAPGAPVPSGVIEAVNFLAPEVQVGRNFEYFTGVEGENYYTDDDDERSIGAAFKEIKSTGKKALGKTRNRGLMQVLDKDEQGLPGAEERCVTRLKRRLWLNKLRRAYAALLAAAGAGTTSTWSLTSDPDALLMDAVDAAGDSRGVEPNALLMGRSAWITRFKAYRSQEGAGGFSSSGLSLDAVAALLNIDKALTIMTRYATSKTLKAKVVGSVAIGFFRQDNPDLEDPSTLKRFVTPVEGGIRVYRQELDAKRIAISVEDYDEIIGFGGAGTFRLNVAAS